MDADARDVLNHFCSDFEEPIPNCRKLRSREGIGFRNGGPNPYGQNIGTAEALVLHGAIELTGAQSARASLAKKDASISAFHDSFWHQSSRPIPESPFLAPHRGALSTTEASQEILVLALATASGSPSNERKE